MVTHEVIVRLSGIASPQGWAGAEGSDPRFTHVFVSGPLLLDCWTEGFSSSLGVDPRPLSVTMRVSPQVNS